METVEDIRKLPELGADTIHVWGVHVPDMLNRLDELRSVLCEREAEKAARFRRESDRQSSISARGALRILLSGYTGAAASDIDFHYSENGKPYIADLEVAFNVTHSGEWVVLAFGRNRSIGVDIEQIRREVEIGAIASRYFTAEEVDLIERAEDEHALFFQLWARKEAYVKAAGSTLFSELSRFAVPVEDSEKDGWHFRRLDAGSKYAVAVVTDRPVAELSCYDFGGLKWDS